MWVLFVLLGCVLCIFGVALKDQYLTSVEDRGIKQRKCIRTAWRALWISICYPKMPNYVLLKIVAKLYGKIAVVKMHLTKPLVSIADMATAKKIMNDSAWINRLPSGHYLYETSFGKPQGLVFSNGEYWRHARKLTIKLLHQCGIFNPNLMTTIVQTEFRVFETKIFRRCLVSERPSQDVFFHEIFQHYMFNIISAIVLGCRYEEKDSDSNQILTGFRQFNRNYNVGASLVDLFPFLRRIPGLTFMDDLREATDSIHEALQRHVNKCKADNNGSIRGPPNLVQLFLREIQTVADQPASQYITEEGLVVTARDILFAGMDTTSNALEYAILYLLFHPEVQLKVYQEIEQVIGLERLPTAGDKDLMPYTQATMLEILRLASPVPLSGRTSLTTSTIDGYLIPEDSLVIINLLAIHMDQDVWSDAEKFRPERFLSGRKLVVNRKQIIPFGFGKRACPGEAPAQLTLFVFLTSMVQKFEFSFANNHPVPDLKNIRGISRSPAPFWAHVTRRQKN